MYQRSQAGVWEVKVSDILLAVKIATHKPDTRLTVSEWADQKRILPAKATKEAGRWRTARTPYLKEIMDCLSPSSPVEQVVFMKGAQVGGTECGNNWLTDSGVILKEGTLVDATIIKAPTSTKNKDKQRDPDLSFRASLVHSI